MDFITDKKQLASIIKSIGISLTPNELNKLSSELYKHIDYTSSKSYSNGYLQGKFDCQMDELYKVK